MLGELSVLLDQPHTADVRAVEESEYHVADAPTLIAGDPGVALYVAALLARRLEAANQALVEIKRQLEAGDPRRAIGRSVDKVAALLSAAGGISLVYAGYPYDPLAHGQSGA